MTFVLKEPQSTKETPILCVYHFNGRRLKFSTGELIHPSHWNKLQNRPRKSAPCSESLTKFLNRLENRVREMHLELKSQFVDITPDSLKAAVVRDIRTDGKRETLVQYWQRYIDTICPNPDNLPSTHKLRKSVYRFQNTLSIVKAFPRHKDFSDITPEWMESFMVFNKNKYSQNYIQAVINTIKYVMGMAKKDGLHRNETYLDVKTHGEESDAIYLSNDELMKLYAASVTGTDKHIRDRFIIGAFTGLRFSDNAKITMAGIRDGLIFDKSKKTKANVVIPIHWIIEDIMAEYGNELPPMVSTPYMNKRIKDIAKDAGITTKIMFKGKEVSKHTLVCTHTARRSFATNAYLAGIPTLSIRYITGHKTESAFMKYIRINSEENARLIASHEFFTRPAADLKTSDKS